LKVLIAALMSCMMLSTSVSAQVSGASLTIDFSKDLGPMKIDRFSLGQGGFSSDSMFADRTTEIRALKPRVIRLFVQDYFDLLPAPGKYHFATLDASVDAILKAGATPLLSIVFKPKVLFPRIDQDLVEPTSWKAWESLIQATVSHYKQRNGTGWYWEVGNEWDQTSGGGTPYHMTPAQYTRFYEHTITAIRGADSKALVGGPGQAIFSEPLISALLEFCDKNKIPLDFISWHGYHNDPQWFRQSIDSMHEQLRQHPGLNPQTVQTVIDEWNMDPGDRELDPRLQPAFIAETTYQMIQAGLDLSCYYHIRDYPFDDEAFSKFYPPAYVAEQKRFWDRHPNYLGLFDYQNQARPAYFVFRLLERLTGNQIAVDSASSAVHGLATLDKPLGASSILVWNYSDKAADVSIHLNNIPASATAWRYVLDATGPSNDDTARIRPQSTQKMPKGNGNLSFRLEPWGITMISLENTQASDL